MTDMGWIDVTLRAGVLIGALFSIGCLIGIYFYDPEIDLNHAYPVDTCGL
jgi:hypothetical protein